MHLVFQNDLETNKSIGTILDCSQSRITNTKSPQRRQEEFPARRIFFLDTFERRGQTAPMRTDEATPFCREIAKD